MPKMKLRGRRTVSKMKREKVSSDIIVLLELMDQPGRFGELMNRTGIPRTTLSRVLPRLLKMRGKRGEKIVVKKGKKYSLRSYPSEEEIVLDFLNSWERKHKDLPPPIDEIMLSMNKDPEDVDARKNVRNILAKHHCNPSPPVPYEDRRKHTEELREVIEAWKEELPLVSDFDVDVVKKGESVFDFGRLSYKGQQELAFERQTLFPDLRNHLEPEVFKTWSKFKEESKRFWSNREKLTGKIEEMLKENLGAVGVHDGKGDLKCGFMTPNLIQLVLKVAYALPSEQGCRMFTDYFVTGLREAKLEDGYLIHSAGENVLRISHGEKVEKTKENMKRTVEEIRKKCSGELKSLRSSLSTLEGYRGEIIRILERYPHMPVLNGYCNYLILSPRTI